MLERDILITGTCELVWTYGGGPGGTEASPELDLTEVRAQAGLWGALLHDVCDYQLAGQHTCAMVVSLACHLLVDRVKDCCARVPLLILTLAVISFMFLILGLNRCARVM